MGNLVLATASAPGTPSSGYATVYVKSSDKRLYWKDDAGTEHAVADTITLGTEQAATSGTSKDFTIPSGVKKITVMFKGVSTNGTSNLLVQLGDAGGIETSGYSAQAASIASGGNTVPGSTAGFLVTGAIAGSTILHGQVILSLENSSGFSWCSSGCLADTANGPIQLSGGSKSTSQEVTTVRITAANGTDAFDAGAINVQYEY